MQIADTSPFRGCAYHRLGFSEEKSALDKKSGKESSASATSRPRKIGKQRPSKAKAHNPYHRLDHTYAAVRSTNSAAQSNPLVQNGTSDKADIIIIEDEDAASSKNSWLRNLCLEYQPRQDNSGTKVLSDSAPKVESSSHSGINGLKQYHRNRKVKKNKSDSSRTHVGGNEITPEDQKRWTAALALLELQRS